MCACCTLLSVHGATTYLISPSAKTAGESIVYNNKTYVVGKTAFADFADLMALPPTAGTTVYVAAGTYSKAFTVNVKGLNFRGINAYQDPRTGEARTQTSTITAKVTLDADSVTFNGFNFSGAGCINNATVTNAKPIDGFKFIYNVASGGTMKRSNANAYVRLGKVVSDDTANDASSQNKLKNITISHNMFTGTTTPNHIILAGASVKTDITDNTFTSGADAIRMDNATGTVNITFNNFNEIGQSNINDSDTKGDFTIVLNRCAQNGTSTFNILNNDFNKCVGETSLFPCIRFYSGDTGKNVVVTPVGCTMNIKYNVFRGKTQVHDTYNYLYYANKGTSSTVKSDIRNNYFDRNDYRFAFVNRIGNDEVRSRATSCYGLIKPSECTFGTYKSAVTTQAVTVLQSFDVDPETGDIYYIQLDNASNQAKMKTSYGDPKSLVITRLTSAGVQTKMQLVWAGHGTNMAVGYIDGVLHIFTGGRANMTSDGSETRADACCWFQYVPGAVADLRQESFTYGGKSYPIYSYDWPDRISEFPAVDEISRLFCARTTGKDAEGTIVNRYQIFDLDEILADPDNATPIKSVTMTHGLNSTGATGDKGYNTWDHQGWTINGDYLYVIEGVGTESTTALNKKSTIVLHVYNWRTDEFAYREFLSTGNSTLLAMSPGEPEGVKVRRNSDGQCEILIGVTSGSSGARKATIFKYTPKAGALALTKGKMTPAAKSVSIEVKETVNTSKSVKITNTDLTGGVYGVISGPDATRFSVSLTNKDPWNATTTAKITYKPTSSTAEHTAYLRLSSPMADDVIINLSGTNSSVTGVEDAMKAPEQPDYTVDDGVLTVNNDQAHVDLYSISGVHVLSTDDTAIDVSALRGLYIMTVTTPAGRAATKLLLR